MSNHGGGGGSSSSSSGGLGSAGSRSSLVSVGRMPIISEDDNSQQNVAKDDAQPSPPKRPPHLRASSFPSSRRNSRGRPSHPHHRPRSSGGSTSGSKLQVSPIHHSRSGREVVPGRSPLRNVASTGDLESAGKSLLPPPGSSKPMPPTGAPRSELENEKAEGKRWLSRRGGWWRVGLIALVVILGVVGLSVGLTLGLRKGNGSSRPPTDTSIRFPAGSFAFQTYLIQSANNCTSERAPWRCHPFVTYSRADNSSDSAATFFWTISAPDPDGGRHAYGVSSPPNPFAPRFSNVTMMLRDGNTPEERLEFRADMRRTVIPGSGGGGGGGGGSSSSGSDEVTCEFETVLRGVAWTGRIITDGTNRTSTINATTSDDWSPWPGHVEVSHTAERGPECKDSEGNSVSIDTGPGDGECICRYANFGLD